MNSGAATGVGVTAGVTTMAEAPAARPFVKYVGGKRQILPQIMEYVPRSFNAYHEPFVGGGALYWHLHDLGRIQTPGQGRESAYLSDRNARLVRAYRAIQDNPEAIIQRLSDPKCAHDPTVFDEVRRHFNASLADTAQIVYSDTDIAAFFIYLNKTCFNGLFRENRAGGFNVPFGKFSSPPTICDAENLRACSTALRHARVTYQDFRVAASAMRSGDFVYFDCPYAPMSATSDFTSYGKEPFGPEEQVALRDLALTLAQRGVQVLLSNSSAPLIRELYADFDQIEVQAKRAINCDATKRGSITELLLLPRIS